MSDIALKFEIDVLQIKELDQAVDLAVQNRIPAIVVHPDLYSDAVLRRIKRQGRFKIITPIDWPKGDRTGIDKFKHLSLASMEADGFEILLGEHSSVAHAADEMNKLTTVIGSLMNPMIEVRFCLDVYSRTEESIENQLQALCKVPAPACIRTSNLTSLQQSKANIATHFALLERIKKITARPIKLSGNVTTVKCLAQCNAYRYGVSFKQAFDIINEYNANPERYDALKAKTEQLESV